MNDFNLTLQYQKGNISNIDLAFGRLIQRLDPTADPCIGLVAALVSRAAGRGHVCLDLSRIVGESKKSDNPDDLPGIDLSLSQWVARLHASRVVGSPGSFHPLILDVPRLYLHRLWSYEHHLARNLEARMSQEPTPSIQQPIGEVVETYFSDTSSDQHRAARTAAEKSLCVITGGPGSGKTYTIARIILILNKISKGDFPLRIWLSAPTGKAASRLQEAIASAISELGLDPEQTLSGVNKARTLHRLLGFRPSSGRFQHDADNPLAADVVIVDESSMIDLNMMTRLAAAVPMSARLILVGDKDQLASVEAGAVLGDICHGLTRKADGVGSDPRKRSASIGNGCDVGGLDQHIVILTRNYRFGSHSGIERLCKAVNSGDANTAISLLVDRNYADLDFFSIGESDWHAALEAQIIERIAPLFSQPTVPQALDFLKRSKILAAVRKGPFGVESLNAFVEKVLRLHALIPSAEPWYLFRPVIINRNDYANGLFNGDVGIVQEFSRESDQREPPKHELNLVHVAFDDGQGAVRWLAPHQLPEHETVYAMTVHKSQGSEFDHVLLILPDRDVPVLTRELIYTAITRARKSLTIWGDPDLLATAIGRRTQRISGLSEALWGRSPIEVDHGSGKETL